MYRPRYSISQFTFPIAFGFVLLAAATAFMKRDLILGNIDDQKRELFKDEDIEGRELLRQKILEHKKNRLLDKAI